MFVLQGKGVSGGMAPGRLKIYSRDSGNITAQASGDPALQWARFENARRETAEEYEALSVEMRQDLGSDAEGLFSAHRMIALDPELEGKVSHAIFVEKRTAEEAVSGAAEHYSESLKLQADPFFRSRAEDLANVSERILRKLAGKEEARCVLSEPVILAADTISPAELVRLDRRYLRGLVLRAASAAGHAMILARMMGIPAVVEPTGFLLKAEENSEKENTAGTETPGSPSTGQPPFSEGAEILLDGSSGSIYVDPDAETMERYEDYRIAQESLKKRFLQPESGSGQMKIECNVSSPEDIPAVLSAGADGIGLFRSEFLFLNEEDYPGEEKQFEIYRELLLRMDGRPVTVRLLDPSEDKYAAYFDDFADSESREKLRGIRFCLAHPAVLKTQLRALFRAASFGNLRILLPMVTEVSEVREVKTYCDTVRAELRHEGRPFEDNIPLGVMIETPAAALAGDALASEADFFACGTNDLTQYTLGIDRDEAFASERFEDLHPAVRDLLVRAAESAKKAGIPIGVCGECAANPVLTSFFAETGFDELSVPPSAVPRIRESLAKGQ